MCQPAKPLLNLTHKPPTARLHIRASPTRRAEKGGGSMCTIAPHRLLTGATACTHDLIYKQQLGRQHGGQLQELALDNVVVPHALL